jgi:hypothetical protein
MVRTREALYGNYLQRTTTVRMRLLNRKDFSAKFLEKSIAQLSVRTALVHRSDGTRIYHCSRLFCSSAYKWRPLGIENCKNSILNSTSAQRSYFSPEAIASVLLLCYI